MIMLILAPLVGVLGALLLAYGAWRIYPPAGFVVDPAIVNGVTEIKNGSKLY
ncbi:hypothetical protein O5274_27925, partial [Escherichia coli]|nr:hypothetical protein [Escherichia coli]